MNTLELKTYTADELLAPVDKLTVCLALITPDVALEIVSKHNPSNRTPSQASIGAYLEDMAHGRWTLNGDTIRLSHSGQLTDGQHRLWAVANGKDKLADGVPFIVVKGIELAAQETMDAGRKRTVADQLNIGVAEADQRIGTKIVAAMRALYLISGIEGGGKMGGGRLTNAMLYDMLRRHPKLVDSVKLCQKMGAAGNTMKVRPAVVAAVHYASQHLLKNVKGKGADFVKAIADMQPTPGYAGTDPAWQLAAVWSTLEDRKHISENDAIKLVTLAWDRFIEGGEVAAKTYRHNMAAAEAIGITRKDVTGEEPEAAPVKAPEAEKPAKDAKKPAKGKTKAPATKAPAKAPKAASEAPKVFKPNSKGVVVQTEGPKDGGGEEKPAEPVQTPEEQAANIPLGA